MVETCNTSIRKLSAILISAFIQSRVIISCLLFFTAWLRPFYDDRLVTMEMLSLIVCFLTFFWVNVVK